MGNLIHRRRATSSLLGWKLPLVLLVLSTWSVFFVLAIVVLLQSGSAADLAAGAFGGAGSQTAFGPRGPPPNFLSKATTWCAVMLMLISLACHSSG